MKLLNIGLILKLLDRDNIWDCPKLLSLRLFNYAIDSLCYKYLRIQVGKERTD